MQNFCLLAGFIDEKADICHSWKIQVYIYIYTVSKIEWRSCMEWEIMRACSSHDFATRMAFLISQEIGNYGIAVPLDVDISVGWPSLWSDVSPLLPETSVGRHERLKRRFEVLSCWKDLQHDSSSGGFPPRHLGNSSESDHRCSWASQKEEQSSELSLGIDMDWYWVWNYQQKHGNKCQEILESWRSWGEYHLDLDPAQGLLRLRDPHAEWLTECVL